MGARDVRMQMDLSPLHSASLWARSAVEGVSASGNVAVMPFAGRSRVGMGPRDVRSDLSPTTCARKFATVGVSRAATAPAAEMGGCVDGCASVLGPARQNEVE